jgi:protein-disulfide isomerase
MQRLPRAFRSGLLPLVALAMSAATGVAACADDPEDFVGDPASYSAPPDRTAEPLLCPETQSGAFNNASSPFRWGAERVEVQVDVAVDFRCPACLEFAQLADETWGRREDFRNRVRLYFHHFPLESLHPGTAEIHVAAAAAAQQGFESFWALHDRIFQRAAEGEPMSREQVEAFLEQERKLDMEAFQQAMLSDETRDFVQWDKQQAVMAGAAGTPSVFVCGEKVYFWSLFEQAVDSALTDQ